MKLDPSLPRKISEVTLADLALTDVEFNTLVAIAGQHLGLAWDHATDESPLAAEEKILVQNFKTTLKKYLYHSRLARYCCFCGCEMQIHDATKDLEHLVSKKGRKHLVFFLQNIALSCKDCNGPKWRKKVTVASIDEDALGPTLLPSSDYLIVHPYLDEWQHHFLIDEFKRVLARDRRLDSKGNQTIQICGINRKNAMRLADHFTWFGGTEARCNDWVNFYSLLHGEEDRHRLSELTAFARDLADALRNPDDPSPGTIEFALGELLTLSGHHADDGDLEASLSPSLDELASGSLKALGESATDLLPGTALPLALPPPQPMG